LQYWSNNSSRKNIRGKVGVKLDMTQTVMVSTATDEVAKAVPRPDDAADTSKNRINGFLFSKRQCLDDRHLWTRAIHATKKAIPVRNLQILGATLD
jgi:hypothetical protein